MTCPHCGESAPLKGFRPRTILSLLGSISFERYYYYCPHCGHGNSPLDAILGLRSHDLTPAADEVICLAGLEDSFATGSTKLLHRLAGLKVSESTMQRTTEAAGERFAETQHAATQNAEKPVGQAKPWNFHKDAEGKTIGYISVDATGVGQQGPKGAKAEGRMVYIGMVYNPVPEDREQWADPAGKRPAWQSRYVAQVRPLAELMEPLRRQAGQVGFDQAERWVALSDGGSGLEDFLRVGFPRVEAIILDFYHVAEYLGKLAKALHPGDEEVAEQWRKTECECLKKQGGQAVLDRLRARDWKGSSKTVRTVRNEVVGYFEKQVHRMDYPSYVAKGWQIGSGPVESACKTVIGERMKSGGMRWGGDGADAMSHLRALFCSETGQWEGFWSRN